MQAVTLCNLNPLRMDKLEELNRTDVNYWLDRLKEPPRTGGWEKDGGPGPKPKAVSLTDDVTLTEEDALTEAVSSAFTSYSSP